MMCSSSFAVLFAVALVFAATATATDFNDDAQWNLLQTGPWSAREGLMGTFYKGFVWMSGGRYSPANPFKIQQSLFYNDVWKLDPSCVNQTSTACNWQLVTEHAAWQGRAYHIMFTHRVDNTDYMYVIGGQNLSDFFNDVWRSTDGVSWEPILPSAQAPFHERAGLAAISYATDGSMYVTGGCFGEFPNRVEYNDVWRSLDDGRQWELVIANQKHIEMHVRSGPRVQIYEHWLYILAGEFGFSEFTQLADVWRLDLDKIDALNASDNAWQMVVGDAPFANRSGHGFVVDSKGTFWVIAGYLNLHDLWQSTDEGVSWHQTDVHVFNCADGSKKCGRYDFWAQLDDSDNLFLYGGDSSWDTFGGEWNETYQINLDSYT